MNKRNKRQGGHEQVQACMSRYDAALWAQTASAEISGKWKRLVLEDEPRQRANASAARALQLQGDGRDKTREHSHLFFFEN
jgi:hypothetical protein